MMSTTAPTNIDTDRYAKCVANSRRISWDIDNDVIRGREFDMNKKFLPDGLSRVSELPFLTPQEKLLFSQVQGRTYANMFGLVERFICATVIDATQDFRLGDQVALEALVRFSNEELKHQELFRRLDRLAMQQMPADYQFVPDCDEVAQIVLGKSTWSVLGLTLLIELFTQAHYRQSIEPDNKLSALWKDVFLYHWKEESQHAILDELEWQREHEKLTPRQRDRAVDELIELVAAVDGILQAQSRQDAHYFVSSCDSLFNQDQVQQIRATLLAAYRWQYIVSGVQIPRFIEVLTRLTTKAQLSRIEDALVPIFNSINP